MNQPFASESAFSAFFRNLPDTLRQPFSLAVIGSMGAHLFFFLWLPLFTPEETKPEVKRVVGLLNSSPLPQASTSTIGLPPIPKTPTSKVEIPLGQSLLPPDASLYKFQDPILSSAPPAFQLPRSTTVIPNSSFWQTLNLPPRPGIRPKPTASPSPTQTPFITPPPPSDGRTDSTIPPLTPGVTGGSGAQTPTSATIPATSPTQPATPTTARPGERLLAENLRLRESLTFKSPGATQTEVESNNIFNYGNWFKKNVADRGITEQNLEFQKEIPVEVSYNLPFNLTEKFQPAFINVLIAPDGSIASSDVALTGRTGYGILDDLATREVFQRLTLEQKEGKLKPTGDNPNKYVLRKYKVTFKGVGTV